MPGYFVLVKTSGTAIHVFVFFLFRFLLVEVWWGWFAFLSWSIYLHIHRIFYGNVVCNAYVSGQDKEDFSKVENFHV